MTARLTSLTVLFLALSTANAEPIRMTVRPAAAPVPALKYTLLPPLEDQTPGNAAYLYLRATNPEWLLAMEKQQANPPEKMDPWRRSILEMMGISSKHHSLEEKMDQWGETPLKELPMKDLRWLQESPMLRELDLAARRESCDWELTTRVRKEVSLFFPDLPSFRKLALCLSVRCRLEIADQQYDKAAYSLQTGYALGRHLGQAPTLIHGFVGLAIVNIMTLQLEEFIQAPQAPNLYWALTDLRRPLVDMHACFYPNGAFLSSFFPNLKEIESVLLSPRQEQELHGRIMQLLQSGGSPARNLSKEHLADLVAKKHAEAKRVLLAQGRKAADVEAMPALQAVFLYSIQQHRRLGDDFYKWLNVPYWEARSGYRQAAKELRAATESGTEGIPLASLLLPAVQKVHFAQARTDRRFAALRCLEAVRLYAAAHNGKPPASLADIKNVPLPIDPATGKSFEYRVQGSKFMLEAPLFEGEQPARNTLEYEITLKP